MKTTNRETMPLNSDPMGSGPACVGDTDRNAKGSHFCARCFGAGCVRCGQKGRHDEHDRAQNRERDARAILSLRDRR